MSPIAAYFAIEDSAFVLLMAAGSRSGKLNLSQGYPRSKAFESQTNSGGDNVPIARGFTLIEIMIVVAIVAILAAIAISQYQDYVIRSQIAEGPSLATAAKTAVAEFYAKTGHFPAGACTDGNSSVGLASPASISGSYVSRVFVAGEGCAASLEAGSILAVFSSDAPQKANVEIDSAGLIFEPAANAGSIAWRCKRFLVAGSVVLKDRWLPSSCR